MSSSPTLPGLIGGMIGGLAIGLPIAWWLIRYGYQGFKPDGIPWSKSKKLVGRHGEMAGGLIILLGLALAAESLMKVGSGVLMFATVTEQNSEARLEQPTVEERHRANQEYFQRLAQERAEVRMKELAGLFDGVVTRDELEEDIISEEEERAEFDLSEFTADDATKEEVMTYIAVTRRVAERLAEFQQVDLAEKHFRSGYEQFQQLLTEAPSDLKLQREFANHCWSFADVTGSTEVFQQGINQLRSVIEVDSTLKDRSELGAMLNNLSNQLSNEHEESITLLEEAIEHQEAAYHGGWNVSQSRRFLNHHYTNIIPSLTAIGRLNDAASVVGKRRELLSGNSDQLYAIAKQYSDILESDGELTDRDQIVGKTIEVLKDAFAAGKEIDDHSAFLEDFASLRNEELLRIILAEYSADRPAEARDNGND